MEAEPNPGAKRDGSGGGPPPSRPSNEAAYRTSIWMSTNPTLPCTGNALAQTLRKYDGKEFQTATSDDATTGWTRSDFF